MNAYLSLSSPLSDERRSLSRYLGPRESNSFATVVIATGLGLFLTLVCILTFLPSFVAIFCVQLVVMRNSSFRFFAGKSSKGAKTLKAFTDLHKIEKYFCVNSAHYDRHHYFSIQPSSNTQEIHELLSPSAAE